MSRTIRTTESSRFAATRLTATPLTAASEREAKGLVSVRTAVTIAGSSTTRAARYDRLLRGLDDVPHRWRGRWRRGRLLRGQRGLLHGANAGPMTAVRGTGGSRLPTPPGYGGPDGPAYYPWVSWVVPVALVTKLMVLLIDSFGD
jgi:hypothetical protein